MWKGTKGVENNCGVYCVGTEGRRTERKLNGKRGRARFGETQCAGTRNGGS